MFLCNFKSVSLSKQHESVHGSLGVHCLISVLFRPCATFSFYSLGLHFAVISIVFLFSLKQTASSWVRDQRQVLFILDLHAISIISHTFAMVLKAWAAESKSNNTVLKKSKKKRGDNYILNTGWRIWNRSLYSLSLSLYSLSPSLYGLKSKSVQSKAKSVQSKFKSVQSKSKSVQSKSVQSKSVQSKSKSVRSKVQVCTV